MFVRREDLLAKVEALRNILVSRATGEGSNDVEYVRLRRELQSIREVKERLPRLVLTCYTLGDFWGAIKPTFPSYQQRRDFLRAEFAPLLGFLEAQQSLPADEPIRASLETWGTADVHAAWQKALERRERDPEGAITAARTLLEMTCKAILERQAVPYDDAADLPDLYRAAALTLSLAPEQHHEDLFKRILGGCQTVVNGLGTLRNKLGDAHARSPGAGRPSARHAALAVTLAGGMAMFLVETFEAKAGEPK